MNKFMSSLMGAAAAFAMATSAIAAPAPRAFNVVFDGYYLVTNTGTSVQDTIKGIGVITADAAGALSGIEDLTLVNPSVSGTPGATLACSGSLGASSGITANNDGTFGMSIDFVPSSTTGGCFQSTTTYVCSRHIVRPALQDDLAAGQYHCIATGATSSTSNVTIDAVSETAFFGAHVIDTTSGD